MQIDVGASIAELLYEHPSVTIPGLGALVAAYKPAAIDQLEGKITPPSKQISFNKNLLIDDGLLVKHLREKYHLTYGEAMREVDLYAQNVRAMIERREIVTFPQVGRLYKNYEQNYQFLPDETNFNTDSYGLPTLDYYPVARSVQEKVQAAATIPSPTTSSKRNRQPWLQRNLLPVSALGALLIAGGVYLLLQHPKEPAIIEETATTVPTARYNVSPLENEDGTVEEMATDSEITADNAEESSSEGATLKPGTKSAIISIGTFGSRENIDRLIKKIYQKGYEPYTEKISSTLTRIGVQIPYERSADLTKAVQTLSREFDTKVAVYKK